MVYKASEYLSDLKKVDITEYTNSIDTVLRLTGGCRFNIKNISHLPKVDHIVNLITELYTNAGWQVKRNNGSDPRGEDWDYLSITLGNSNG